MPTNTSKRDVSYAADYWAMRARQYSQIFWGRFLNSWENANASSYDFVRKLAGRTGEKETPLPEYGSVLEIEGIKMRVDERMSEHNIRKLMEGRHTLHERRLLGQILEPSDTVMELGGGIGMVSIFCSQIVGSEKVFAYEPNINLRSLIFDNYDLNGVSPTLKSAMMGPDAGERALHVGAKFSRSSIYDSDESDDAISAEVLSFNDEIRTIQPTVLIVDIQGGEAELFDYADLSPIRKLLLEVHPDIIGLAGVSRVRSQLAEAGFVETNRSNQSFLYQK